MSAKAKSKLTPEQQKATMTRVLQKIKPYGFFVVCSLIVAAVSVAAQLYIPILCGSAIDMMLGKGAVDHAGVLRIIYEIIVVAVVAAFAQWLLSVCNNRITFAVSRDLRNAAMRKIDELLAVHPEITAAQRSDIFKSAFFMTKEEHTELVEALIEKLEAQTPAAEKLPIVISGILTDAPALNAILDEMGLHIVADDVAAQSRQYRTDAPERDDALNALAEKFAAMGNCSVLYDQEKNRVKWIVDTAKARSAKGVLVVLTKFCDPEEFDYVMIKKACEAADLPLTLVEVDRQMVRFEQVRTNLETFRDLLKM